MLANEPAERKSIDTEHVPGTVTVEIDGKDADLPGCPRCGTAYARETEPCSGANNTLDEFDTAGARTDSMVGVPGQ